MTTDEKVKHFQESTFQTAMKKKEEILKEYNASLQKSFAEHKAEKQEQVRSKIKIETDSIKRENNKELSKAQFEIKKKLSKKHAELIDKLFIELKDQLEQYMCTSQYDQLLISQINKALAFAKDKPITIYIDPADISKQQFLSQATGTPLQISEYGFMGGTRAVIPDSRILIDRSFSKKLEEAKENFTFNGGNLNG